MPIIEIITGSLLQADADPHIFRKLGERGLTPAMVVDLCGVADLAPPRDPRFVCLRWPIEDGDLPDVHMLAAVEHAAVEFLQRGGVVVSMCEMGRNRSGLLSALILTRLRLVSGADALRHVRSKVPEALTNEVFAAYLQHER